MCSTHSVFKELSAVDEADAVLPRAPSLHLLQGMRRDTNLGESLQFGFGYIDWRVLRRFGLFHACPQPGKSIHTTVVIDVRCPSITAYLHVTVTTTGYVTVFMLLCWVV
ncbi:Uncharacterized protein HZ326_6073 [Fusarium oxysporum f. sp. albedinis]|nr:Uncharacterized protein HZ326_6073 [Fusarium oxysporum f. sp. albedinis]